MKMKRETVQELTDIFKGYKKEILQHKEWLIENAEYDSLEVRLAFDCYHSSMVGIEKRNEIRETEDLKDAHLFTGLKKALKAIEVL